jgi:hypothetical protein
MRDSPLRKCRRISTGRVEQREQCGVRALIADAL